MTTYCTDRNFFEDPDFFKRNRARLTDDERKTAPGEIETRFIDAADLLAKPYEPPSFLVTPIIPTAGALVVLTGDTGSGKTALLLHICICVALGLPVAGHFDVSATARPVLYVNGEMSSEVLRMYLHQALAGLGLTEIPHGRFLFEGSDAVATLRFSDPDKLLGLYLSPFCESRPRGIALRPTWNASGGSRHLPSPAQGSALRSDRAARDDALAPRARAAPDGKRRDHGRRRSGGDGSCLRATTDGSGSTHDSGANSTTASWPGPTTTIAG
jgi:hypothetical protein